MFKLLFLTSNRTKFQHACYLCKDYGVHIMEKSQYGVAYKEPRTPDRDKLFKESIEDAKRRLFKQRKSKAAVLIKDISLELSKPFFLEDTSVRIHALSTDSDEFPGTEIKFWMKKHNFASLDKMLREKGNNRKVTIRSDILLYLPKNLRESQDKDYMQFKGELDGTITKKEHNFKTNELYPWLDNQSFNKWFVPRGCRCPLGMLSEKEASKYDFRAGAFKDMLEFLERKNVIDKKVHEITQGFLPFSEARSFLVCGLPCAGKTTLGEFLSEKYGYYHIEASDFMYLSYHERHGITSTVRISDFAEKTLKDTPAIVVDQILIHLKKVKNLPFVITGFRSPKELEIFEKKYRGVYVLCPIYIEANSEIRYMRNLGRKREGELYSEKGFYERDKQQLRMGLNKIRVKLSSEVIFNNADFESYFRCFLEKYPQVFQFKNRISQILTKNRPKELEDAILIALLKETREFTTTEIAHYINNFFLQGGITTNKNNVSRYFNKKFHPYFEIETENKKIKYRISGTGKSRARVLIELL